MSGNDTDVSVEQSRLEGTLKALEAAIASIKSPPGQTEPIVKNIIDAAMTLFTVLKGGITGNKEQLEAMQQIARISFKLLERVSAMVVMVGRKSVMKVIVEENDANIRRVLDIFVEDVEEACETVTAFFKAWKLNQFGAALSTRTGLRTIFRDIKDSSDLLHQYFSLRMAEMMKDCTPGDDAQRIIDAIDAEVTMRLAQAAISLDDIKNIATKTNAVITSFRTQLQDGFQKTEVELQKSLKQAVVTIDSQVANRLAGIAAGQHELKEQIAGLKEENRNLHETTHSRLPAPNAVSQDGPQDGPTDGPTDGTTTELVTFADGIPLVQQFDTIVMQLRSMGWTAVTISKKLGYSGHNGHRDLLVIRAGRSSKCSLKDAVAKLYRASAPTV